MTKPPRLTKLPRLHTAQGQPFTVVVDACPTPGALSRMLDAAKEAGARKAFLVVGCEGANGTEHVDVREMRARTGEVAHFKVGGV